jgi:hypothetical protein
MTLPAIPSDHSYAASASNWWPAACSVAIGCAYLAVSWHTSGPAYLEDEIGYLANAAFFAGHRIDAASSFHAGYSLFIAPTFLFSDPSTVWRGVLAINALLWAANFAMLYKIMRRLLPYAGERRVLGATVVSALYPTWIVSSSYAFATTAFVTVFLASILALFLWRRDNPLSILPHSILIGYLYWVHPTGAAVALASALVATLDCWQRGDAKPILLHLAFVIALIVAYQRGVHPWIAASMTPPGYAAQWHYPTLASALDTLVTPHGFVVASLLLIGQFAYFIVASFGIAFVGLTFCIREALSPRADVHTGALNEDARAIYFLISAAPIGVIALASISFFQNDNFEGNYWIYGRYLDGAVLPLVAIGFAVFRADIRLVGLSLYLLAIGLLLNLLAPSGNEHNIVNTVSFWPQYLSANAGFFIWMLIGALAVAGVARYGRRLAIALMVISFPLSVYRQTVWHDWLVTNFSTPSLLVQTIRSTVRPGSCVGVNPVLPANATFFQSERYHLNSFYLFDYAYRRMSPAEWLEQCNGPYLSYNVSDLNEIAGIEAAARDPESGLLLFRKQDALSSGSHLSWAAGKQDKAP